MDDKTTNKLWGNLKRNPFVFASISWFGVWLVMGLTLLRDPSITWAHIVFLMALLFIFWMLGYLTGRSPNLGGIE